MNRKSLYNSSCRNLGFGVLTIFASITFMMQIDNALITIKGGGVLSNVEYTIFALKLSVNLDAYSHVYNIFYYPLIPILVGLIYNIFIIIKCHANKDKVNS